MLLTVACSEPRLLDPGSEAGSGGTTELPARETSSSGNDSDTSLTGGMAETTGSESSGSFDDPTAFIQDPDGGYVSIECSVWDQNCPPGQKCMPWANDGGSSWNSTRCSPIADDPGDEGDPCTVEGSGVSGIDDCDLGLVCWEVDPDTNAGVCHPLCIGSENNPLCKDPGQTCSISGDGVLNLCLDACTPLTPDCPQGQACYPIHRGFVCAPDASGDLGAYADPCEFINVCNPGLACIGAEFVPDCSPSAAGCCSPYCDTTGPNTCPGEGQECVPWFEPADAPAGFENAGICSLP